MSGPSACGACLARTWLLARLAGNLDRGRQRLSELLALGDEELIAAIAGAERVRVTDELAQFDADAATRAAADAGLTQVCRCDPAYPALLQRLDAPPAVLHVAGKLERLIGAHPCTVRTSDAALPVARDAVPTGLRDAVAIVGARAASPYGLTTAATLARRLAVAGLPVVSGMALGIDSAAHQGALDAGGLTIAVLPANPGQPYPRSLRRLHGRIREAGVVLSELGPGVPVRSWMFPARNRIIAALSAITIVIQARFGSGSRVTVMRAQELGRLVGAVPGQVGARLSELPNALLRDGAVLVRDAGDVIEAIGGLGGPVPPEDSRAPPRPSLQPELELLLDALADGFDTAAAFERAQLDPDGGLAALSELELLGLVVRQPGGRFAVSP